MPLFNTPAVIIRSMDFSESDKLVTFFTQKCGKIKGIAKGAKRSKKRFSGTLELFSLVNLQFFEKSTSDLTRIDHCDLIKAFSEIRRDIKKVGYASYFMELIDEIVGEKEKNSELFEPLVTLLSVLNGNKKFSEGIVRIFEIRFLSILGYQPNLNSCTLCRNVFQNEAQVWFSPSQGGAICHKCSPGLTDVYSVSRGTLKILNRGREISLDKIDRLAFSQQALSESKEILSKFIRFHLNKDLKSLRFMDKMKKSVFKR